VKIGTPLSRSATRVMLLGSGELGKEVIISLQRFGVEVIAVDRYANAPGHQVAHRAHVIDMTDGAALRALVEQEKPQIIVPEIEAMAFSISGLLYCSKNRQKPGLWSLPIARIVSGLYTGGLVSLHAWAAAFYFRRNRKFLPELGTFLRRREPRHGLCATQILADAI